FEAVGIRGDIDALPIQEMADVPFKSVNDGVMHACGHDMHGSMLLGSAKILKALENEFSGTVKFFFQPAEETVGGADPMIKDGCLQNPEVGAVISFHVTENHPTGHIEMRRGKMNAAICDLILQVEGVSCHGAHPENGVDAIVVASNIVTALQSIISRNLSPTNSGIITIGTFHAGTKDNIVAGTVDITGTLRALDMETMETLKTRVRTTCENIAAAYGAKAHLQLLDNFPPLENDDELFVMMEGLIKEHLGEDKIYYKPEPSLGGDDFAYFCNAAKGIYMNVGTNPGTRLHPQLAHNEYFEPDEEGMKAGMLLEVLGALEALKKEK
ncbi:MAG: amidohydrolase, partial [Firmicutes bacterium]|nr:amidohydrolase [Bacillota bacterium]